MKESLQRIMINLINVIYITGGLMLDIVFTVNYA